MKTTLRNNSFGAFVCMLACTCAWGASDDWMRIASERSIAADSPEQHEVREWLQARAAPGLGTPGALRLGVTRVFPGQSELSAAASGLTPGLFPPVTTDGNVVRVLSCSGGRTEWAYRADDGRWVLQHYAALGDVPCDVTRPLAKTGF
jgi:hypothetical protein